MSQAVDAFIAGEVPAVAFWVPFNLGVRDKLPDAIKLVDASAFYPQSAVVGGWVARMNIMPMFSSREWRRLYSDGTVVKSLQQVSDFFMAEAGVTTAAPATEYFDSSLYLATVN